MATYRSIAKKNEESMHRNHNGGFYQDSVYFAQQAGEKYLKAILEQIRPKDSQLRSHRLEDILVAIDNAQVVGDLHDAALYLTSFYFNTRYPGDSYSEVVEIQSAHAVERLTKIKEWCEQKQLELDAALERPFNFHM